jgi:tRNA 2-selenouridine synthase
VKSAISLASFLEKREKYFVVDVRSPSEFHEASMPGAVNIPLFDDEERAIVGTVYHREGTDRAKRVGLSLVAPKLTYIMEAILDGAAGREIVLYCWRGGLRSRSIFVVLDLLGYPVRQLQGGYKAFRRQVVAFFDSEFTLPVFVLNGLTGVGKTLVIRELQTMGEPAIDLEAMANHRGSVFGGIGLGKVRSQKDFEALLFLALYDFGQAPYLIVEGEGKRIGPVHLPETFFRALQEGSHILLEADLETRVSRTVDEYLKTAPGHTDKLVNAVFTLEKRLGRVKCEQLALEIRQGHMEKAARTLCTDYYDRFYKDSRQNKEHYLSTVNVNDLRKGTLDVQKAVRQFLASRHGAGVL